MADRTNDVNWRFPCAFPGLAILLYPSRWVYIEKCRLRHVQKHNMTQDVIIWCLIHPMNSYWSFYENVRVVHDKSCFVFVLFTFMHSLVSHFAAHSQPTTNYRLDIPRVLQRFSIIFKTLWSLVFECFSPHNLFVWQLCSFKQKCMYVHHMWFWIKWLCLFTYICWSSHRW